LTDSDEYIISLELSYTADDYAEEFYYIIEEQLDSSDLNTQIALYSLDNTTAQSFKIIYKDENFLPVEGVLQLQRNYISEGVYKTVEQPRIDTSGEAIMQVELEDAVYTINIIVDGAIDAVFSNIRFYCPNPLIDDCSEILNKFESYSDVTDFATVGGVSFTFDYNDTTRVISSPFSVLSGTSKNVEMRVKLYDAFGNQSICNDSLISSSGTLSCTVPNSFGNASVVAEMYASGEQVGRSVVRLDGFGQDNYGLSIMIIGIISLLLLIMIGLTPGEPILYGIFLIVGVILLSALNIIFSTSWIGAGATFLWFIIAVILITVKGANR